MKVKVKNINALMAKNIINPYELCTKAGFSYQTYRNLLKKSTCKPATAGRLAKALGVDVTEIIEQ
mgnify:CR=1 FL=1